MNLAEKYLIKFLDNNKIERPLSNFVRKVQNGYNSSYRHLHPMLLQWNITPKCNLRCKHCYYAEEPEIYTNDFEPSLERKLEIIDEINELNIFHIIISGGEALLCDGIFEILKKLKSMNIAIYMHSNGIALDKNIAQELSKIFVPQMDAIQISLDGLKETHEKTRGTGTFDKAIKAIENLVSVNIPVCVNFTLTTQNIHDAIPLYQLVSELGVMKFSILKFVPCSEAQKSLVPTFEEQLKVSCDLIDIENNKTFLEVATYKLKDFIKRNLATEHLIEKAKTVNPFVLNSSISCHKHAQLFIAFDGEIYACREAYVCKELSLGNIKNISLIEAWNNRFENPLFIERNIKDLKSENCPFIGLCNGGCPLESYLKYKDINATCTSCPSMHNNF